MADVDPYSVLVLESVESRLTGEGFHPQAERVAVVIKRLRESNNPGQVLKRLYSVEGWDKAALLLLWLEEKAQEAGIPSLLRSAKERHVLELFEVVTKIGGADLPRLEEQKSEPLPPSQDVSDSLVRFDAAVGILKQRSLQGDEFIGIEQPLIEILQEETDALRLIAAADDNQDIVKFCTALSIYLVYVVDKGRTADVRTLNVIDNANLTLQTVLQTMGATDYDSLQQTTQLLENPGTLME